MAKSRSSGALGLGLLFATGIHWLGATLAPAIAQDEAASLYQCRAIVTGTDAERRVPNTVSYTHLTLPTILRV